MNVQIRSILSASAGFAAVLLVILGVTRWIVQPAFQELEQAQALEDGFRARAVIQGELRQLDQKLGDWAEWDDAYAFAANPNPAFIQSNLGDWSVLENSTHLNLCVILDRQGRRLYGGGYDSDLGGAVLPAAFADDPPAIWTTLRPALDQEEAWAGLLLTEYGLLLLAARPILTTQGTGPPRGLLIFGRFLDEPLGRALAIAVAFTDVTERQRVEDELRRRDRLLEATADAMGILLSGHDLNEIVGVALAILGQAVAADRVYIFQNHIDPATGAPLMSQLYEWSADSTTPQIDNPDLQNLPYQDFTPRWYPILAAGAAVKGLVREFPETERLILEPQAIRSILVLPIRLDDYFWGFIGFDDCHADRVWTAIEENILRNAGAALGHTYVRLRAEAALRESEEQYRTLVDNLNIGVYRNTGGSQGWFLQANPAIIQMFGYESEADFFQVSVSDLYANVEEQQNFITEILSQGQVANKALHLRRQDGTTFWGAVTARVVYDDQGEVKWLDGVIEDITERQQAEARQGLAAVVFEAAREAILVTDAAGKILAVNPAFTTLTGYAEAEVRGRSPRRLWAERQPEAYFQAIGQTVAHEGAWEGEFWVRRKDGERRAALANLAVVRDATNQVTHYVAIATDITASKVAEQRIAHLAYYDMLTDLPNRALLVQRAELALALAARRREALAVLLLDLDRFKEVND